MSDDLPRFVRRAAVLGAGVMGAQIAAHLANAEVPVLLFDLPGSAEAPDAPVLAALQRLRQLHPSPLVLPGRVQAITPAHYERDLERLRTCALVIEAVAEDPAVKRALYARVAPYLGRQGVLASNTSGLPIGHLAQGLPESLRPRFCGLHFFNPPRFLPLVELTPHPATAPAVLDWLETFLVTRLGKQVLRARDTPAFIANRVGVFATLATIHHAERHGLGPDLVDELCGPRVGHARSATFRTLDLVGLDLFAQVVRALAMALRADPWVEHFQVPPWIDRLVELGALGQKSGAGVYRNGPQGREVLDPAGGGYRPVAAQVDPAVDAALAISDPGERLAALRGSAHPQAQFLWSCLRELLHYCAVHLEGIAGSAADLDLALRWGFGWSTGPFETWQAAGWQRVLGWLQEDLAACRTLAAAPLPAWVLEPGRAGVHGPGGSYAPATGDYQPRLRLPVYRRQLWPERLLGEPPPVARTRFETAAVRLWDLGDELGVLSFKTPLHIVGEAVLDAALEALERAERDCAAVVLWQVEAPFCAGADLKLMLAALEAGDLAHLEAVLGKFQALTRRLRHGPIPTVAAVQGMALGGGCELVLHCDAAVVAMESYLGLVEAGVGLVPGGGGCKELALRAHHACPEGDLLAALRPWFERVARAEVSGSAEEARAWGYLQPGDAVLMHPQELLYAARARAQALVAAGYRPPLPAAGIRVAGRAGQAALGAHLLNLREGGFISAHDQRIATRLAWVLCGGEVEAGSLVDEDWLLRLEREAFLELAQTGQTRARIAHLLATGKPLRN